MHITTMKMNEELLFILRGFRYAETINPIIRITYFSYDDNETLSDESFTTIEDAEKWIAFQYTEEGFSDDEGELRIYLNGIEKSFDLYAKINV